MTYFEPETSMNSVDMRGCLEKALDRGAAQVQITLKSAKQEMEVEDFWWAFAWPSTWAKNLCSLKKREDPLMTLGHLKPKEPRTMALVVRYSASAAIFVARKSLPQGPQHFEGVLQRVASPLTPPRKSYQRIGF